MHSNGRDMFRKFLLVLLPHWGHVNACLFTVGTDTILFHSSIQLTGVDDFLRGCGPLWAVSVGAPAGAVRGVDVGQRLGPSHFELGD